MHKFLYPVCGLTVALLVWTAGLVSAQTPAAQTEPDDTPPRADRTEDPSGAHRVGHHHRHRVQAGRIARTDDPCG